MKARIFATPLSALAALALASGAALAADPQDGARSRADVVQETLAARAAGALAPAGELPVPLGTTSVTTATASTLTRSAVQSEVRTARASGELVPAGEGVDYAAAHLPAVSLVSRAEVKASVIAARRAGELVPAGEGPDAEPEHVAKAAAARTRTAGSDEPRNAQIAQRP
ncbi:MAG TPA: hypothetical protein VJO99_06860 [Burkholderiaceae bacterium]|nr:hypothetical protein [Burkholderiaceae bacterium]